jgi:hypothetical protein
MPSNVPTHGCRRYQWAAFEHIPNRTLASGSTWSKKLPATAIE